MVNRGKWGRVQPWTLYLAEKCVFSNIHSVPWCYFSSVPTEWDKWAVVAWRAGQGNRRHKLPKRRQPQYHALQNYVFRSSTSRFCLISLHMFPFSTFSLLRRFHLFLLFLSFTSVSSSSLHKFLFSEGMPQQQFQFCLSSCTPPHTLLLLLIVLPSWTDTASREEGEQP